MQGKVELCGVNTSNLPLLKNAEMRELIGSLYAYVFDSKKVALLTEDEQNEFIGALKRITKEAEEQAG